ncbi:hypothetical protein PUNSTDRAFT_53989 [Punctularia strigosozonata HHB-11173 SS5]|uniref:uncharacterized protein n=1 Tax=Punctularia strigosozonata (strain HHB-11173) TaxID=741275 RepID=UPI00044171EA|nr:uncharacterized protein PUNSTDRAFT_53989 [Punctularia strigosozonata HHB-11173 SS5]EIN06559.1 hypothetical protein PUNSTDRAFT_53989 [Punctularia strigosozonata HHB-11173 SS5]
MRASFALAALAGTLASAKDIVITVGGNTTTNASLVFQPQEVHATLGDTVIFNFTQGNHTATQSTFASPCIPAHETNITINGFDSSFRDAGNGTAITILSVPILPENVNTTMWFYDAALCGKGGVGVINANDSSLETLAGFERNAVRLNGTGASSTVSSHSATATSPSSSASASATQTSSSGAERALTLGGLAVVPLLLGALATL